MRENGEETREISDLPFFTYFAGSVNVEKEMVAESGWGEDERGDLREHKGSVGKKWGRERKGYKGMRKEEK